MRGQLLAYTDFAAPNFRIVRIDPVHPDPANWHDVVPESDKRIQQFAVAGDQVFVTRVDHFSTKIEAFGLDGERKEAPLPFRRDDRFAQSDDMQRTNCSTATLQFPNPLRFIATTHAAKKFSVGMKPTLQSIFLRNRGRGNCIHIHRRDLGSTLSCRPQRPLTFGPTPDFPDGLRWLRELRDTSIHRVCHFLIEQGFLFAVPALRGGSELGEQWHRAGKRENRQNSFNDFVAAAEWLIREKRSISGRIAIGGGSNAGLLVGAAITQRPDLFRAAICLGPLLDMTRYHLFDFAAGWADEYGSPEDQEDFQSLLAYSPYHHVLDRAAYPAVLLISGDADTRCNPMHARKMAARLQACN